MLDGQTVTVRYMVDDVASAVDFYVQHFGFNQRLSAPPVLADLERGNLRLLLGGPLSSAGESMSDGEKPHAGGWNRIQFLTDDLDGEIARLRASGVKLRNEVVTGRAGSQVLVVDPSGNFVEIFQSAELA